MRKSFIPLLPLTRRIFGRTDGCRQSGIATVLIMLLIGMSLSAAVLGTAYYIRSTQDQGMAAHAQAQAQIKAWTATEIVRMYLQQLKTDGKLTAFLAQTMPIALSLTGDGGTSDGATGLMSARVTAADTTASTVTVEITGVSARGTKAEASSKMQEIYSTGTGGASSQQCVASPKASAFFKGDVSITGGTTSVTNGTTYSGIAVEGNLTIQNASSAIISGCVKGNINLSGGGIDANATLTSEGAITIISMATPTNATLWAKTINIGNTGSGSYNALKAGAYSASVGSAGVTIGNTNIGGNLIPTTAGTTIPWTTGSVIPLGTGSIIITLTDGTKFLLDLSKTTISSTTGVVTNTSSATRLNGNGSLPDTLTFTALSIYGGGIDIYTQTVGQMWGNKLNVQGYGGTYSNVLSNDEFKIVTGTVTNLVGGGNLWATNGGCSSPTNCYNFPTITNGNIAGSLYYGSGKSSGATLNNLAVNQVNTSPGLPGIPYCDTRADTVSADAYKSQANYVFEFVNGLPQLTIQNVKNAAGLSLAGIYSLRTPTVAQQSVLNTLMTCGYSNNPGCLQTGAAWLFSGVQKFPPGVVWFDSAVTIDGTTVNLLNSFIGKGDITLTSAGHLNLTAPNFSTPALICDGSTYPTNLCNKTTTPSTFVTWNDSNGVSRTGLPIANMAVLTEGGLTSSGWTINGNVVLGGQVATSGATTNINGSVSVGVNSLSSTTITSGGLKISTTQLNASQVYLPSSSCTSTSTPSTVKILSSRYI